MKTRWREAFTMETVLLWLALLGLVLVLVVVLRDNALTNERAQKSAARTDWTACLLYNQSLENQAASLFDEREARFEGDLVIALTTDDPVAKAAAKARLGDPPTFRETLINASIILSNRRVCIEPGDN